MTLPRKKGRRSRSRAGFTRRSEDGAELSRDSKDSIAAMNRGLGGSPLNMKMYDPDEDCRIPPEGAWVQIVRALPAIEGGIDEHVSVGRVFYATRDVDPSVDPDGFAENGTYKVVLNTPWGSVKLWPYEYRMVPGISLVERWQRGDLIFHPVGVEQAAFSDTVHYIMSRGIDLSTAACMVLGTEEMIGDIGWFELPEELVPWAEALTRIGGGLTEVNHERRRAARARRLADV